jgi:hypothetical protein
MPPCLSSQIASVAHREKLQARGENAFSAVHKGNLDGLDP